MGPEKLKAIVLKTSLFRDSSLLITFFTDKHGIIKVIAKGILKKRKKNNSPVDRGTICEAVVYPSKSGDLYTLGEYSLVSFFGAINTSIIKCSARDAAFEMLLKTILHKDEHTNLFYVTQKFLYYLQNAKEEEVFPLNLWLFYYRIIQNLGISFNVENCSVCKSDILSKKEFYVYVYNSKITCSNCIDMQQKYIKIPASVLQYISGKQKNIPQINKELTKKNIKEITYFFVDYISFHFDIKLEIKSLEFLISLL